MSAQRTAPVVLDDLDDACWVTHPEWAGADPPWQVPVLRHRWHSASAPSSARLTIAGLGVWVATLNGRPVTDDALEPGTSDPAVRVATRTIDVTGLVRGGENELLVELGEGSAHVREAPGRYTKFTGLRVPPRARIALVLFDADADADAAADAVHPSGGTWEAALGATTLSHWFGGEDHDGRRDLGPDAGWVPVAVVGRPGDGPQLWVRGTPPVRVVERFTALTRQELVTGVTLFDVGRNIAGRQVLTLAAGGLPAGARVQMWPAEHLGPDGHVDQESTGRPIVDTYTSDGGPAVWHPRFCYHGFRYLEVRVLDPAGRPLPVPADALDVTAERLMTDDAPAGSFSCSDPVLTGIDGMVTRAVEANLMSVPTDCPHREKLGWLEQLHLVFEPVAHRFDIADHFADVVVHVCDAQTPEGLVPDIAPELVVFDGGFRDDVNWGSAVWHLPHQLHRTYGTLEPARQAWAAGLRYLDHLDTVAGGGVLDHGLGDWKTLDESTPRGLVAGSGHVRVLEVAVALAAALGRPDAAAGLRWRADRARALLRGAFVTRGPDGRVRCGSGSQSSWALVMDLGVLDEADQRDAAAQLLAAIRAGDHQVTVGEIGLPPLVRVLTALGEHEVLRALVTREQGPSYGRMLADGCTSLAEDWQGTSSANHFMFGYVSRWLSGSVGGLAQHPASTGWRRARVAPVPLAGLTSAATRYVSVVGEYAVDWTLSEGVLAVDVVVPEGASAELVPPPGFVLPGSPAGSPIGSHPGTGTDLQAGSHHVRLSRSGPPASPPGETALRSGDTRQTAGGDHG